MLVQSVQAFGDCGQRSSAVVEGGMAMAWVALISFCWGAY